MKHLIIWIILQFYLMILMMNNIEDLRLEKIYIESTLSIK